MTILSSGPQHEIVFQDQRAIVSAVGATLRQYRVGQRDVITTFDADALPVESQGQHLLPWPSRIRDGRYSFGGHDYQLPINEVDKNNAIHGFASWHGWELAELYPNSVTCRTVIYPKPGWPGTLLAQITHTLTEDGLTVEINVHNEGTVSCPFGYAAHPYLNAPNGLGNAVVTLPFTQYLETDDRLLPVAIHPVAGTAAEISGHPLADTQLDTSYTRPRRDLDGRWRVKFSCDQESTTVWGDENFPWLQLYTPKDRKSLAIEPATCGPDAFNQGPTYDELIVLAPSDSFSGKWGLNPN